MGDKNLWRKFFKAMSHISEISIGWAWDVVRGVWKQTKTPQYRGEKESVG